MNEEDMLKITKVQEFVALPNFLADPADTHFHTNLSGGSRRGSVTCWPEAVQYLLRTPLRPLWDKCYMVYVRLRNKRMNWKKLIARYSTKPFISWKCSW